MMAVPQINYRILSKDDAFIGETESPSLVKHVIPHLQCLEQAL